MKPKKGDTVLIHYTGYDGNRIFDTTTGKLPYKVKLGGGTILESFENELMKMNVGEKKSTIIKNAYGERNEAFITELDYDKLGDLPEKVKIEKGVSFELRDKLGTRCIATIADVMEHSVLIDLNHPLAGKDLKFDIELLKVN